MSRACDDAEVSSETPSVSSGPATTVVEVTTVWAGPTSPRDVDAAVVGNPPDVAAWLSVLDEHADDDESGRGRMGLHGRVETQLVAGEPVHVVGLDATGRWAEVRMPWQPSPKDPAGYPGWVPAAHLAPADGPGLPDGPARRDGLGPDGVAEVLAFARAHIGLQYLWSGTTPLGFDCSGLVHTAWRRLGVMVPRDAYAQAEAASPVALADVRAGDLYFFARPGRRVHHVGIVTAPGRMVHASETGGYLVEEDLPPERLATLVAAGRFATARQG